MLILWRNLTLRESQEGECRRRVGAEGSRTPRSAFPVCRVLKRAAVWFQHPVSKPQCAPPASPSVRVKAQTFLTVMRISPSGGWYPDMLAVSKWWNSASFCVCKAQKGNPGLRQWTLYKILPSVCCLSLCVWWPKLVDLRLAWKHYLMDFFRGARWKQKPEVLSSRSISGIQELRGNSQWKHKPLLLSEVLHNGVCLGGSGVAGILFCFPREPLVSRHLSGVLS